MLHYLKHNGGINWFASKLKTGDSIFESACGIGNNLLGISTVLNDDFNIVISLAGNEILADSVKVAREKLAGAHICQGDSTDLSF